MEMRDALRGVVPTNSRSFLPAEELVLPTCLIGVEVELERVSGNRLEGLWHTTTDGSLHDDGLEYRFAEPLFGRDIIIALTSLEELFGNGRNNCSNDCSTHIHIDIRDLDSRELQRFILLYYIYEDVILSSLCKESRRNNIFCLPLSKASNSISSVAALLSSLDALNATRGGMSATSLFQRTAGRLERYGAINMASITKFGSLEFRGFHAATTREEILLWINIIMSLKKASKDASIPHQKPYLAVKSTGVTAFTSKVFGDLDSKLYTDEFHEQIHKGMQLARTLANHKLFDIDLAAYGATRSDGEAITETIQAPSPYATDLSSVAADGFIRQPRRINVQIPAAQWGLLITDELETTTGEE